ncbi:uncharacterized protein LACBIDRAFT_314914 [Laccaria bicolor S238N-H82]|uniref:Predicted protein n=1 Tax=Laccaria bicolor (strain S238N-H82 / ATCC MYA-4686) TaxID=486041 RepID=B0DZF7_LACBS|nr:uncharacterized protein LACBIDRAFT_314914 [Laccaria bicolor S238N-H82]EDR00007.1 predicted protein [Laccaria bicolor S238N-H82]|eukprot:XP_001889316.1 predicted protein [Laccaria bicolor S238N-H82]
MVFEHQNALYLIYATFARMENGVDQRSITDYNFVGDLQWLIPLSTQNNCQDFQIDPCQRAYVHLSGPVTNVHKESETFKLDVEHYISAFRDLNNSNSKPTGIKPITSGYHYL